MTEPVDLTNLREMTDGDTEMERELFAEFFSSSEELINVLVVNCIEGENEEWRASAHALKGMSYNLGADPLGNVCKIAQEKSGAGKAEKEAMLEAIQLEYARVHAFLSAV